MKNIRFLILILVSTSIFAAKERIVAIDGSVTEILYSLGVGDRIVGIDSTSTYPEEARKLPSVGYMRALSIEGILSLKPSLVIATKDAKPQSVLLRLQEAGVKILLVENDYSLQGVFNKINQIADFIGKKQQGKLLVDEIKNKVDIEIKRASLIKDKFGVKKALLVLNMRAGNIIVAGSNTRADAMLKIVGIINPASNDIKGYKPLNAEALIKYNPDFIIYMKRSSSKDKKSTLLKSKIINATNAGKGNRIIVVDSSSLQFGPRISQVIRNLSTKIYRQR